MWIYCSTWGFIFCYIKLLIKPSDFSPRSYYSYCVYNWFHKSKILDKPSSWATVLPIDCGRVLGNSHEYSRFLKYMIFKKTFKNWKCGENASKKYINFSILLKINETSFLEIRPLCPDRKLTTIRCNLVCCWHQSVGLATGLNCKPKYILLCYCYYYWG